MTDNSGVWIRRTSTAAGLAYTAIAEYELARRLGAEVPIAVMLPLALDCYVIAALKWFRAFDVFLSLTLMGAAQVCAHALDAGVVKVNLDLVAVVSLLVPIALWRTHALARQTPQDEQDAAPSPAIRPVPEVATEVPQGPLSEAKVTLERNEQKDADGTPELLPGTDQDAEDADDGPPPEPPLMTSAQVAERYGIAMSTVRTWVDTGRLTVHSKDARNRSFFHPDELPVISGSVVPS
ncbi:hypothetical protein ACFWP7_28665 [Streptomyces sp. NPDC058470]|uniref:hypothetical protein n=1 Tax=Streptomyces sp. NPDC058470 TaxID=3346515 RepID=UPI003654C596